MVSEKVHDRGSHMTGRSTHVEQVPKANHDSKLIKLHGQRCNRLVLDRDDEYDEYSMSTRKI